MTYSSQNELITFRYRGLHTGPLASDKNMDTPLRCVHIFIYTIFMVLFAKSQYLKRNFTAFTEKLIKDIIVVNAESGFSR